MKKQIYLALIFLFALLSCNPEIYKTTYIQGQETDLVMPIEKMRYNAESKLMYAISNNTESLFINIRVADEQIQNQIMAFGLTIWIDTLNRKNKVFGLTYPFVNYEAKMARATGVKNYYDPQNELNETSELLIYGLEEKGSEHQLFIKNNAGITVEFDRTSDQILHYKAILPLKYISNIFSIGCEIDPSKNQSSSKLNPDTFISIKPNLYSGNTDFNITANPNNLKNTQKDYSPLWIKNVIISK